MLGHWKRLRKLCKQNQIDKRGRNADNTAEQKNAASII